MVNTPYENAENPDDVLNGIVPAYTRIYDCTYNESGQLIKTTLERESKYEYDPATYEVCKITEWTGDGNEIASTNADLSAAVSELMSAARSEAYLASARVSRIEKTYADDGSYTVKTYIDGVADVNGGSSHSIVTEKQYDSFGRLVLSKDGNGGQTSFTYDKNDNLIKQVNPDGTTRTMTYDYVENHITLRDEVANETDEAGQLANHNGTVIRYQYDGYGRQIEVSALTDSQSSGAWTVLQEQEYDRAGRLQMEKIYQSDTTFYQTEYTYNEQEVIESAEIKKNGTEFVQEIGYSYEQPNTHETMTVTTTLAGPDTYTPAAVKETYDGRGLLIGSERQVGEVQPDGSAVTKTYRTDYTYDLNGNMLTVTDPRTNEEFAGSITLKTEYDYAGQKRKETDLSGNTVEYRYDRLGQLIASKDPLGNETLYTYDAAGRNVRVQTPFESGENGEVKYYYDDNGNQIREEVKKNEVGAAASYNRIENGYGSQGELLWIAQYDVDETGENVPVYTRYAYDASGRMTEMETGLSSLEGTGSKTEYVYNSLGQLVKTVDAEGKATEYEYDLLDNVVRTRDRNGTEITSTYDGFGRELTREAEKDGVVQRIEREYNVLGQPERVVTKENGEEQTRIEYEYDTIGRVVAEEADGREKAYAYDAAGNRTYSEIEGMELVYEYTAENRLSSVTDEASGREEARYTYDASGRLLKTENGAGVKTERTYGLGGQVKAVRSSRASTQLESWTYEYQVNGAVSEEERSGGVTSSREYGYDGLGRLSGVTSGGKVTQYEYDLQGNRVVEEVKDGTGAVQEGTTYTYGANNRLETETRTAGGTSETRRFSYDGNGSEEVRIESEEGAEAEPGGPEIFEEGHRAQEGVRRSEYDAFGRLSKVVVGTKTVEYAYDGLGRRSRKVVNGEATQYVWDGDYIVAELDESGNAKAKYVRGLELICEAVSGRYYLTNAHGDVTGLTDGEGNVVKQYAYDAFGNEEEISANAAAGAGSADSAAVAIDTNPFRYCGEYVDLETGQVYLRARMYEPGTGRFTQEDPAKDGTNWYTYCANDPVNFKDPSGHWAEDGSDNKYGGIVYNSLNTLSNAWLNAKTQENRDSIHALANRVREIADTFGAAALAGLVKQARNGSVTIFGTTYSVPEAIRQLNETEIIIAIGDFQGALAMDNARQEAIEVTAQYYGNGMTDGDNANAFKHSYWNAIASKEIGTQRVKYFTDAHEFGASNNNAVDQEMDLFNNGVGRYTYFQNPNASNVELADILVKKIKNGGLLRHKLSDGTDLGYNVGTN